MAALKIVFGVFVASLLGVLVASKNVESNEPSVSLRDVSHNINECVNVDNNKTLVFSKTVNEDATFLYWKEVTVKFPESGINNKLITCLQVSDKSSDGSGGYPTIVSGGINNYDVEILLKSQWNCGLHFDIKIYVDA